MTISRAGSVGFGFTGRIDGNSPAAGSKASLSTAPPDNLEEAMEAFDEESDGAEDHAQVDGALGRIMGMSVEQAAGAAMTRAPGNPGAGAGAMIALAVLRSREGVC